MRIRLWLGVAVTLGFVICCELSVWDWGQSLIGVHFFRQTQTAITAYWFVHEGIRIDYQTPVLGKPWAVPFEFPLYQVLAALLNESGLLGLDASGRAVSLFFWLVCLYPLGGMLRWWLTDGLTRWAVILMVWSSPTYIYWSDSFMMESTALFFSLMFIYMLVRSLREASSWLLLLAIVCGVVAGLQKATTFLIVAVPALIFAGKEIYRYPFDRLFWKNMVWIFLAFALPLMAIDWWTHHADALKDLNPLARGQTSEAKVAWNFGTLTQRESIRTWYQITKTEAFWGLGHGLMGFLAVALLIFLWAIWKGRYRFEIIALSAGYLVGPVVFTNLFFVHEYYNYETGIYLQLAFALAVIGLIESYEWKGRKSSNICCAALLAVSFLGLAMYRVKYVTIINAIPSSVAVRQSLVSLTNAGDPQDVLLIYGWRWNSFLAYYSGRKAIMDMDGRSLDDPKMRESLALLSPDEHIAAMVVYGPLNQNAAFIRERVERFHLQSQPIHHPWGEFYLKAR